jgi:CheY-like chemotaxis protein
MSRTILVVEDDASVRCLILYFLREQGYGVFQARDGIEAVELLDQLRVDIVLSDVKMPRMDGVALARHIRSNVPNTKMLLMTACSAEEIKTLVELGVPVMRKPLLLDELQSQIQKVLGFQGPVS